ncbi:hypothetical protein SNEBB_000589 [Seison nebaliae]|nr:hypothetical protein SNEBB_000589 [Seison nebaliae]
MTTRPSFPEGEISSAPGEMDDLFTSIWNDIYHNSSLAKNAEPEEKQLINYKQLKLALMESKQSKPFDAVYLEKLLDHFYNVDTNRDGKISRKEFIKFMVENFDTVMGAFDPKNDNEFDF